jgi:hypothetical protein
MGSSVTPSQTDRPDKKLIKNNKRWLRIAGLLLLLAVLVGAVAAFYPDDDKEVAPDPWGTYTNEEFGIKFDYLKEWGSPDIQKLPASTGSQYFVTFTKPLNEKTIIKAVFDSEDLKKKPSPDCKPAGSSCVTKAVTSKSVMDGLAAEDKDQYVSYSDKSYSLFFSGGSASSLSTYAVVDLEKINSSAALVDYSQFSRSTCPSDDFAPNGTPDCVTAQTYDNVLRFINSIANY